MTDKLDALAVATKCGVPGETHGKGDPAMDITELLGKRYLGDGVYCGHDGHQIWIYASNGEEHTKPVAIEAGVMDALLRYAADLWKPNRAPEGGQVGVP